jgi:hypothetical protein
MLAMNFMMDTFRNAFLNTQPTDIYDTNNECLREVDIPLWPLFDNLCAPYIVKPRYLNRENFYIILNSYDIEDTDPLVEVQQTQFIKKYKNIQCLSQQINNLKQNITLSDDIGSDMLKQFLEEFRHKCTRCITDDGSKMNILSKDVLNDITPLPANEIFNNIYYKKNKILSIEYIYSQFRKEFYYYMFEKLYDATVDKLKILDENTKNCTKLEFDCSQILKNIEFLDTFLIYDLTEPRADWDSMFELHEQLFIRKEQKNTLEHLYNTIPLLQDRSKDRQFILVNKLSLLL